MWTQADFWRLDHGHDFRGDVCGKPGTTVEKLPYVYYFDPLGCPGIGMCVDSCPAADV